jgi:HEAT repeat protein
LAALIATVVPSVHLVLPRHGAVLKQERIPVPSSRPESHVEAERSAATPTPSEDGVLSRLALAETASERCELLGRVESTPDPRVTYAITSVLERAGLGSVRACATLALGLQPNQEAQSWLIELSFDPVPEVHASALSALAAREDSAARAVVVEATHAENVEIRLSAVLALLHARREEGFSAALAVLPSIEDRAALASLVDALGESHDARALETLQALLDNSDRESHLHAIAALGELGVAAASARLERLLELGSAEEFQAAAQALIKLQPERALAKLRGALSSSDEERPLLALAAIAGLDSPDVVPLLEEQLHSGDDTRAVTVLRRLARKPVPELETELAEFAASADPSLRRPALRALERLDTPSAHATAERLAALEPGPGSRSLVALARDHSEAAQAELLQGINDPAQRVNTLNIVAELAPASTLRSVVAEADTFGVDAKRDWIQGLAQRGDPSFSEVLRAALHDEDQGTRNAALQGLLQLGDEAALWDAQRMARANDPNERAVALDMLAIRTDAVAERELEALAADSDVGVVSSALHAIEGRAPERLLDLASRAFRGAGAADRVSLLSNLNDLKNSVTRPLYEIALREGDDDTVIQAVHSLAALQGPESAQRLLQILSDSNRSPEVRSEAASGLRDLGGPLARSNRGLIDSLSEPSNTEDDTCDINP